MERVVAIAILIVAGIGAAWAIWEIAGEWLLDLGAELLEAMAAWAAIIGVIAVIAWAIAVVAK